MSSSEQNYQTSPLETAEENHFEFEEQVSRKVLPKVDEATQPSFFARWFAMVPPNAPVREEEYYWPSGQALEADNFSEGDFERYLERPRRSRSPSDSESEIFLNLPEYFPEASSADDAVSNSDGSYSRQVSYDSDWSQGDSVELMEAPLIDRQLSDWTRMPSLLPPLKEVVPAPPSIQRQESDWNVMPKLLPPLPKTEERSTMDLPDFEHKMSDWSEMPSLLPPLMDTKPSDTSDWVPMPENIVPPAVQQASWDTLPAPRVEDKVVTVQQSSPVPIYYPQFSYQPSAGFLKHGHAQNTMMNMPASTSTALVFFPFMILGNSMQ